MGFTGGGSSEILDGSITPAKLSANVFDKTNKLIQENALNILVNSAGASTTLNDWEEMILERFIDEDGQLNNVDTSNTTATFDSVNLKYKNVPVSSETRAHGKTSEAGGSITTRDGVKLTTNQACKIISLTKKSTCAATKGYILDSSKSVLASADFSGDVATFNYDLSDATTYYFAADANGGSYANAQYINPSYPIVFTEFNFITGLLNGADQSNYLRNIESVQVVVEGTPTDLIVQLDKQDIEENPQGHQVYCKNSLSGSASITYDISLDNGVTWVTGQELNTKNTSVHEGSEMIVKLNLDGSGYGNIAEAEDIVIMLFN